MTTRYSKRILVLSVAFLALICAAVPIGTGNGGFLGLSSAASGTNNTSNNSVFYLAVDSYGSFTANMNPFSGIAPQPYQTTAISLVYQPLMYLMNGESPQSALATSYKYSSNLTNITFTLRSGAEFNNGAAFNASAVVFSFDYIMSHNNIDPHAINTFLKSVQATGSNQVSFYTTNYAYTYLYTIMSQPIVYPGQWQNQSDPYNVTLTNPIATGPYMAKSITTSQFELTWNTHYYYTGKHISTLIIPSYPDVTTEANALASGNINWFSGGFDAAAPSWANQSASHYYFKPPSGFLMLWLNTHEWPLNNSEVRTAMAFAINRQVLSNESLQPPAANFIEPALSNYFNSSFLSNHPNGAYYTYDTAHAATLMEKAGFTKGSDGYWKAANGTEINITLSGNGAASNVVANLNEMVKEFAAFGIHAKTYLPSGAIFYANVYDGNYSVGMGFLASTVNPIGALQLGFSSTNYAPIGTKAFGDYSRYQNKTVTQDLAQAANQSSTSSQIPYIAGAMSILMNDTPAIPVAESISQNEFNTYGYSGINDTSFTDALYSNNYGLISIAIPLVGVYSTTSTSTGTGLSTIEYVAIGAVVVIVIAAIAVVALRRGKTKEE